MEAACPRRILNKYLEITDTLPRHDDLVFIASKRSKDKNGRPAFKGIGSQTVAHDVGAVMTLCGVPARFKPHSTRHVKLSTEREIARAAGKGIDDAKDGMLSEEELSACAHHAPTHIQDMFLAHNEL